MKYTGVFVITVGDSHCCDTESCTFINVTIEAESYSDAIDKLVDIGICKFHRLYERQDWKLLDVEKNS